VICSGSGSGATLLAVELFPTTDTIRPTPHVLSKPINDNVITVSPWYTCPQQEFSNDSVGLPPSTRPELGARKPGTEIHEWILVFLAYIFFFIRERRPGLKEIRRFCNEPRVIGAMYLKIWWKSRGMRSEMEEFAKQLVKGVGCGNAGLDYKRNI
jgi:hypothetical protein